MASRDQLASALLGLGFVVLVVGQFLFVRHPGRSGAELALALRNRAILVRHFSATRIDDFVRISIGTEADNARLIEALRAASVTVEFRCSARCHARHGDCVGRQAL